MKTIFSSTKIVLSVTGFLIVLGACKKKEDLNINPNLPLTVPLKSILSTAIVNTISTYGGDGGYQVGTIVQHLNTEGDQNIGLGTYSVPRLNFNGYWNNIYVNSGKAIEDVIQQAQGNSPYYSGIAKILKAINYGSATDFFGDIPFSDSNKGSSSIAPTYDHQELIYAQLQSLLDKGIEELQSSSSTFSPATDDAVYKGNRDKWIAAAYTLKARYAIHLSKINPIQAATDALTYLQKGIKSNADDLQLVYGVSPTQASPWWQQNNQRPGWIRLGNFIANLLNGDPQAGLPADPRAFSFAVPAVGASTVKVLGALPGEKIPPGEPKAASSNLVGTNTYYGQPTSPVTVITFVEAKFIEAEANLIQLNDAVAQQALSDAVTASFNKVITLTADTNATPVKRTNYIMKRATLSGTFNQKLETLITQKYVALFLNPEVWNDYRRTGYPILTPAKNGITSLNPDGQVPRRFPLPDTEVTLNPSAPANTDYQHPRLWWDK
jgi:hypothetical protein